MYPKSINGKLTKCYVCWKNMHQRCYSLEYQKKYSSYLGCSVALEWHEFENFAKWYHENYVDGWCLDKDILGDGKIYSEDNCCFVPQSINSFFTSKINDKIARGGGDRKQLRVYIGNKYYGTYKTKTEADDAYIRQVSIRISELTNEFKYGLSEKVLKKLII